MNQGTTSHHLSEVLELRADRELAREYFKAALAALSGSETESAGVLALRTLIEAFGDLYELADEAEIPSEQVRSAISRLG